MIILPELCISFYFLLAYCTLVTYVYILFVSLPDIHSFHFIKIKKSVEGEQFVRSTEVVHFSNAMKVNAIDTKKN